MNHALIVDDHHDALAWLEGLAADAFPGIQAHTADTLERGHARLADKRYDLALIDLSLPDGSGLELIGDVQRHHPHAHIVVTTIFDDDRHLFEALRRGAHGYLLKEQPRGELLHKLQAITRGEPPLSPSIARRLLRHFAHQGDGPNVDNPGLSRREIQVLDLLSRGFRRKDIALSLGISSHTAAGHMKSVYRKLHVSGRAEAAREGIRRGLITL